MDQTTGNNNTDCADGVFDQFKGKTPNSVKNLTCSSSLLEYVYFGESQFWFESLRKTKKSSGCSKPCPTCLWKETPARRDFSAQRDISTLGTQFLFLGIWRMFDWAHGILWRAKAGHQQCSASATQGFCASGTQNSWEHFQMANSTNLGCAVAQKQQCQIQLAQKTHPEMWKCALIPFKNKNTQVPTLHFNFM